MRVVAGSFGGRRLRAPEGRATRPTSDRVREAVFNSLDSAGSVVDARVVDLFAGSGALGIEAMSRGARSALFVDSSATACAVIESNLESLGLSDPVTVARSPLPEHLEAVAERFDLVLADPPYDFDSWPALMDAAAAVAAPGAVGVLEADRPIDVGSRWEKMRERIYGGTVVTYVSLVEEGHVHVNDNPTGEQR